MKINTKIVILIVSLSLLLTTSIYLFFVKKTKNIILIDNNRVVMKLESIYTIKAISYPKIEKLEFTSSSKDIIEVDDDGNVTAINKGTAIVKIKGENDTKTIEFEVVDDDVAITSIVIEEKNYNINVGETYLIQTSFYPKNALNVELSYESVDPKIATINDGYIKAISNGTTQINISANSDGKVITNSVVLTVGSNSKEIHINSIEFIEEVITLGLNENYQLSPIIKPKNSTNNKLKYISQDEKIITVDDYGFITAKAKGNTEITVLAENGINKIIEVKVTSVEEGIILNQENIMIAKEEVYPLKSNYVSSIEWYSSNNKVVTVSKNGEIKGITEGKAVVTVINSYGRMNTVDVTVKGNGILVQGIVVDRNKVNIEAGKSYQIKASIIPNNATNKEIFWETSDSRIAVVNDDGLIIGKREGKAIITCYASNNKQALIDVTVSGSSISVSSVEINPIEMTILKGDTYKLVASLIPSNVKDQTIKWSSSDSNIVSVDQNGMLTGKKTGTVTITATNNEVSGRATIYVRETVNLISNIDVDFQKVDLEVGKTKNIKVSYLPTNATNSKFIYISNDPNIATVSNTGMITALSKGTAIITIKSTNNIEKKITVNVTQTSPSNVTITDVLLSFEDLNLQKGQTKKIKATVLPLNANQDVTWVSGNENVVRIDNTGLITAINSGKTVISAITRNGLVAKANVTVQYPPLSSSGANIIASMNSDTMKVTIEKGIDFHITRIWLYSPGQQIHKAGGMNLKRVRDRMGDVSNLNGIVVATNASGFHSSKYESDPRYNGTALGKLIITNGVVLRNEPEYNERTYVGYYYYTFDKYGKLGVSGNGGSKENHDSIIKNAVNTFAFYPVFKSNGEQWAIWQNNGARRQAFCQIDGNNYAIITTSMNGALTGVNRIVNAIGCQTAVNLDGGGSTTLIFKNRGQSLPGTVFVGGNRAVPDMLYFTEL